MPVENIYITPKYTGEGLALKSKIPVTVIAEGSHLQRKDGLRVEVLLLKAGLSMFQLKCPVNMAFSGLEADTK